MLQAGKEAQAYERELWAADVEANEKFLAEKGMTFVEVDKPAFAKIVQPVVEDFFKDKPEVLELARRFRDFTYRTLDSWSCARRVVSKAPRRRVRKHLAP